ncbi:hypothetical protein DFP72DRAFT_858623 [Ephemerocybe angulata]|uniref:Uncharacterized protein n=1 Tax=Ephemerocybe angulata TaxID=980116 RepID=A0A8H6HD22_9AGAR|nr:hypothetical protein DFP72DRAFT_858619 [Tulosesus angulatus]KAF6743637.1 hypothetical protein DFP72DRAFT_858623 [Tulosesus angulatus]
MGPSKISPPAPRLRPPKMLAGILVFGGLETHTHQAHSQASRVDSARGNSIHFTNDFDEHVQKELARPEYTVIVTLPRRRLQCTSPTQGGEDSSAALSLAGIRSVAVRQTLMKANSPQSQFTRAPLPHEQRSRETFLLRLRYSECFDILLVYNYSNDFKHSEMKRLSQIHAGGGRQLSWPTSGYRSVRRCESSGKKGEQGVAVIAGRPDGFRGSEFRALRADDSWVLI